MDLAFYLLIAAAAAGLLVSGTALLVRVRTASRAPGGSGKRRSRWVRSALQREAARRLAQDGRDWEARLILADLAYEDRNYLEAFRHYRALAPLVGSDPRIDCFLVNLRLGDCAFRLKNPTLAYRAFLAARSVNKRDFEVNYGLGLIEYGRRRYAKAAGFLSAARAQNPDHAEANRCLGSSLYQLRMYPEAVRTLEKALDFEPDSRQTRYLLARAYYALDQSEPALEILARLRADPQLGAAACLFAGTIHARRKHCRRAIEDFELGRRHRAASPAVTLELEYGLAEAYLQNGQLGRSLRLWREIARRQPGFKDVEAKLSRYEGTHRNRNP